MKEQLCISVVIPTLDEEDTLEPTLRRLHEQESPYEIIVVDGGSTDATREQARALGATVTSAEQGRAVQMNHGAGQASGDILLFLHADTLLPQDGLSLIRRALSDPEVTSGTFRLEFDHSTPLLRFYAWCTRWPWIRLCFGDRGLFVRRSVFDAVGGYPAWPIYEDLELAARLQTYGGFRFLDRAVITSARRFQQNGLLGQQLRNLYLWTHYMIGTDPERVAHLYPYRQT